MSADRYSICLKCEHKRQESIKDYLAIVKAAEEENNLSLYKQAKDNLDSLVNEPKKTLREDWEISSPYFENGNCAILVRYEASCSVCKLAWSSEKSLELGR